MNMIRFFSLFIIFFIAFASIGQTREEARKAVIDDIALSKKSLPITQSGLTVVDMEIRGNAFITYYIVDDKELDFDAYIKEMQSNKTAIFAQTARNHPMFAKNLVLSRLNMAMVIKSKNTGKTEVVTLLSNELKDALIKEIKRSQKR